MATRINPFSLTTILRVTLLMLSALALSAAATPAVAGGMPQVTVVMELDAPLDAGEWAWDEIGAPAGAATWVVVDIANQRLYAYRGGVEIGRSSLVYGGDETPTPIGTFPILAKVADKTSRKYGNAPMPWSLQLTRGWVAIHGSEVDPQYATHGCIGVPEDFAEMLFRNTRVGDKVTITNNWMTGVYGKS